MCYSLTMQESNLKKQFRKNNGNVCKYCGKVITKEQELTVDHIKPVSRGGATTNENMCICCFSCNQEKFDMTETEYKKYLIAKELFIKNNVSYQQFDNMINLYNEMIKTYHKSVKDYKEEIKVKEELLIAIKLIKASASEGYMLFKDLQVCLNNIDKLEKVVNQTKKAYDFASSNIKTVEKQRYNLLNEFRLELGIGTLKDYGGFQINIDEYIESNK